MSTSDVTVVQAAPRLLAAVRARLDVRTVGARFRESLDQVYAAARAGQVTLDGQNVFVYRDTGVPWEVDADFGVGATAPFTTVRAVVPITTPGGQVATMTHRGAYSGINGAHMAVRQWCAEQGRAITGVRWEVYGHWVADESQLTTEICYQLVPV
jgi:effector-binding domain-containing protein